MYRNCKILYFDMQMPYLLSEISKPVGGAAVEWLTWLNSFKEIGCEPALLTWKGAKNIITKSVDFDIIESFKLNKGIPKIKFIIYEFPLLFWAVKKYSPDYIVQECANRFSGILAIIAKLLRIPFIHRIASDMDVDGRIKYNISKFYLMFYYLGVRLADHISCQNKYQYEILKKKYPKKSISILYNPYKIKETINSKSNGKYIAWIGNFRYEKNLLALASVAKKLPQFQFKIVGTKLVDSDEDTNKGLAELKNLDNVEFLGHLNNNKIPGFLSNAYCLLNTSRLEGFTNTFLEAWAMGVPVITTKNVNPDNLITDFNLGIVADNYESLPEIIREFILSGRYEDYHEKCRNYIIKYHNPKYLAIQFLNDMKNSTKTSFN